MQVLYDDNNNMMEDKENIKNSNKNCFEEISKHYKNYLNDFNRKVAKIYERQIYRNYLKGKTYQGIYQKTLKKRQQLALELQNKKKSSLLSCQKLVNEINELERLNQSYEQILNKHQDLLEDQKYFLEEDKSEKNQIEAEIKEKWLSLKNKELFFTQIESDPADMSLLNGSLTSTILESQFQKSIFCKKKKKQKKKEVIKPSKIKKIEQKIEQEQKKIIVLRLFVSFLKKIDTEENVSLNINIGLTKYFEEIVEEKENVLKKIKEIKKII